MTPVNHIGLSGVSAGGAKVPVYYEKVYYAKVSHALKPAEPGKVAASYCLTCVRVVVLPLSYIIVAVIPVKHNVAFQIHM